MITSDGKHCKCITNHWRTLECIVMHSKCVEMHSNTNLVKPGFPKDSHIYSVLKRNKNWICTWERSMKRSQWIIWKWNNRKSIRPIHRKLSVLYASRASGQGCCHHHKGQNGVWCQRQTTLPRKQHQWLHAQGILLTVTTVGYTTVSKDVTKPANKRYWEGSLTERNQSER